MSVFKIAACAAVEARAFQAALYGKATYAALKRRSFTAVYRTVVLAQEVIYPNEDHRRS